MRRRFTSNNSFTESFNIDNYLTIEALEDRLSVYFDNDLEYGIDGRGWQILKAGKKTPYINIGQTLSFRGNLTPSSEGIGTFVISKKCNLLGNCMSMLFGDNAANNYSLSGKSYAFYKLFFNCTNIVNVSSNFLPATTLADDCYASMFYDCANLVNAPELPVTTLADGCYSYMFIGCRSLVNAPELPATTLIGGCYASMFQNCSSLTVAPELPATTLAIGCYNNMFSGCTSLTTAPELPATTLVHSCYLFMFSGCSKLNYIKMLATDISASYCLGSWVERVASTGTFIKNKNATWNVTGVNGVPSGWKIKKV